MRFITLYPQRVLTTFVFILVLFFAANTAFASTLTPSSDSKFSAGDTVITTNSVVVRATAGGTKLGSQSVHALGTIVSGPVVSGVNTWWQINFGSGTDGWSAEANLAKYVAPFANGSRVQTTSSRVNVRSTPAGTKLGTQAAGATGVVADGPVSQGGNVWWRVNYGTAPSGWTAEKFLIRSLVPVTTPVSAPTPTPTSAPTSTPTISGTAYYIGGRGASDSNAGTSPSAPWATTAKLNSFKFPANAIINQQADISGNINLTSSNVLGPIIYDGNGHTLTASDATAPAVDLDGLTQGVTFQNTIVRPVPNKPTAYGIYIENGTSGVIQGNNVGGFTVARGVPASADIYTAGSNITVTNNLVGGLNGPSSTDDMGIQVYGYSGNVRVTYNTVQNIGGRPGSTGASPGYSGNGISIGWASGNCYNSPDSCIVTIEHNLVTHSGGNITQCGGPSGILAYGSPSTLNIGYNEVSFTQPISSSQFSQGLCDEDGIDLDGGIMHGNVYNNYTHDNAGVGLYGWMGNADLGGWGPNSYTNNYSSNDFATGYNNGYFAANEFAPTGATNPVFHFEGNYIELAASTNGTPLFGIVPGADAVGSGTTFKNNIIVARNENTIMGKCYGSDPRKSIIFSGNQYYGASFTMGQSCGDTPPTTLAQWQSQVGGGDAGAVFGPVSSAPAVPAKPAAGASFTNGTAH